VPKHLARRVHDLYFNPLHEEFVPRTMWSLSNAFTSAFKVPDPIPQFKANCLERYQRVKWAGNHPRLAGGKAGSESIGQVARSPLSGERTGDRPESAGEGRLFLPRFEGSANRNMNWFSVRRLFRHDLQLQLLGPPQHGQRAAQP